MSSTSDRPTGRPRTIDPDAVSLVALRLFDEQGFDTVSMDDVAAAAGISRRSLFRLFPSKAALVWGGLDEFATRFTDALRARPTDEPSATALRAAYRVGASFPDETVEVTRHRLRVIRTNPSLQRGGDATITSLTDAIVRFVAERDGGSVDDLAVIVRASTLAAATNAALTWWATHGEGRPADAVDRAIDLLG
ncbi:TetR family transcriptional regulator [Curtobacterium flaccumfaciens]|uniref:TetR family transcriptional regulator n=1 Tax=Curtobacterium flaccumfaciens TaxID=2035 RepID=A0A4R6DNM2_9MICO|nr:TetR family transcriptional regulator [Curtobacterium flaccumfaciens]TDN46551.1 TetR family transcriptional regulator [Curtobacterium flaccumfaciens]